MDTPLIARCFFAYDVMLIGVPSISACAPEEVGSIGSVH